MILTRFRLYSDQQIRMFNIFLPAGLIDWCPIWVCIENESENANELIEQSFLIERFQTIPPLTGRLCFSTCREPRIVLLDCPTSTNQFVNQSKASLQYFSRASFGVLHSTILHDSSYFLRNRVSYVFSYVWSTAQYDSYTSYGTEFLFSRASFGVLHSTILILLTEQNVLPIFLRLEYCTVRFVQFPVTKAP